jgi:uncharacterized membrane protein YfcA
MGERMMAAGLALVAVAFAVMGENLVYAARFGPPAWSVLVWTLPGAVLAGIVGELLYTWGRLVHHRAGPAGA